jgi:membrane-bound metal-dependent hydrolase YbcI (DUF457 family)
MATPLGHYLLGLSITQLFARDHDERKQGLWLATIACVPDLDIIPGLLIGKLTQFHHGVSHSFAAAAIFSAAGWLQLKWRGRMPSLDLGLLLFLLYASHVVLDFFSLDTGAPYGVPLFWPWNHETYQSPWLLLPDVHHTRRPLLGTHNLFLMMREGLVFLPLIGLVQSLKNSPRSRPAAAVWFYGCWFLIAVWASTLTLQGH